MKAITTCILLAAGLLFQACGTPDCGCVRPPLSSQLMGKWEWVKTVTPSRTITPQTAGYTRLFEHENTNSIGDYIAFYQNDSLYLRLKPGRFAQENREKQTVLQQYGANYLMYFLKWETADSPREMQMSEFLNPYSEQADTVRHYYQYAGR